MFDARQLKPVGLKGKEKKRKDVDSGFCDAHEPFRDEFHFRRALP